MKSPTDHISSAALALAVVCACKLLVLCMHKRIAIGRSNLARVVSATS